MLRVPGTVTAVAATISASMALCLIPMPASGSHATAPAPQPAVVSIALEPGSLQLNGPRALARPIALATLSDGTQADVSTKGSWSAGKLGRFASDGSLHPLQDGIGRVAFRYSGRSAGVPLTVRNAAARIPISFQRDVVPILTRAGCNQGSCHGSQYGKGGFKLSLAGYEPDVDYFSLVRQYKGRRISVADPAKSLMLLKPTMSVRHAGGRRIEVGSPAYNTLAQWIREGAPGPDTKEPEVADLSVFPSERVLRPHTAPQRLVVIAAYSNGATRDVTDQARMTTLDDAVASCTPDGVVAPVRSGQTAIMVRYSGLSTVSTILVPFPSVHSKSQNKNSKSFQRAPATVRSKQAPETPHNLLSSPPSPVLGGGGGIRGAKGAGPRRGEGGSSHPLLPDLGEGGRGVEGPDLGEGGRGVEGTAEGSAAAKIDDLVERKQRRLNLAASPICDDATFIRRVSFDLIGTMPSPDEIRKFLADTGKDRRRRLIDSLLSRPEYADYWTVKWGDLLRSNRTTLGPKGMWSFTNWIHGQFSRNRPIDQFVRDLITAQGSTFTNGPSNYFRVARDPQDLAETTSQLFLGVRLQCARCHHHPFEKWSQDDYYRFAAFFARVGVKSSDEFGMFGGETIVKINDGGEVRHPKTGVVEPPAPLGAQLASLGAGAPDPDASGDRRRALAEWLVGKNDRLFAQNIANRYWGYLFGKGVVNPIDDIRVTNPPTNPDLLDLLANELMNSGYDLKHLLSVICGTKTYQRSSQATRANSADELFFTHYVPKRLTAETLLDAIDTSCGTHQRFSGLPEGTRAIQLPDSGIDSDFLDTFGRPQRLIACECERITEPNLSQTLHLMNGELINSKVSAAEGRVARLIAAKRSNAVVLNELYLCALGRPPRSRERATVLGALAFSRDRKSVFEDVLITLLNSKEFLFNH